MLYLATLVVAQTNIHRILTGRWGVVLRPPRIALPKGRRSGLKINVLSEKEWILLAQQILN